jgi:hypothetical protein
MARRMSNRDRISRMREEVDATEREQKEKRKSNATAAATGAPKRTRATASSEPVRLKAVWAVKDGAGQIVATYPYAFKSAAEAEADRLRTAEKRDYIVCPHKVPFED